MTDWKFIQEQPLEALTDPETIQKLCDQFQIKPTRGAGQNFLIDSSILDEILEAAEINPAPFRKVLNSKEENIVLNSAARPQGFTERCGIKKSDVVLEIGPGFGALTIALAQKAKQVVAVEKDPRIFEALQKIAEPYKNIKIAQGDILKIPNLSFVIASEPANAGERGDPEHQRDCFTPTRVGARNDRHGYKLVANLPYSITSAVLRKFTEEEPKPSIIVVMVQKEVAERVCAKPGEMSLLSVAIQFYGRPEIVKFVPRSAFWPEPGVDSAILKISNFSTQGGCASGAQFPISNVDEKQFFQIVRIGFSSRRKQLQNNLAAGLRISNEKAREIIIQAGFDSKVRAQELSVEDWRKLYSIVIAIRPLAEKQSR